MRPQQQNRRMRGRNNNNNNNNNGSNRKGPNPLTRSYESNGPDVKIRGSAQQIAEKYAALARDAHSAGDRVMAENYLQHAEHYNRIIMAAQGQMPTPVLRDQRDEFDDEDGDESGDQPYGQPQEARQPEARQNEPRQGENREGRHQNEGRQNEHRQNEGRQGENRQNEGRDGRHDNRDGRQQDGRQRDGRREDGRRDEVRRDEPRREDGRRDGENPPREHRREQPPQPAVARETAGAVEPRPQDGSGPQPVIEGMPAEVALEQEAIAGQKSAGRRRGRPPRAKGADGADAVAGTSPEQPAADAVAAPVVAAAPVAAAAPVVAAASAPAEVAAAATEEAAPRRARRPRRPRSRDEGEQTAEDASDETTVPAQ